MVQLWFPYAFHKYIFCQPKCVNIQIKYIRNVESTIFYLSIYKYTIK